MHIYIYTYAYIYIYRYIHIYTYTYICMHIYIYIHRERESHIISNYIIYIYICIHGLDTYVYVTHTSRAMMMSFVQDLQPVEPVAQDQRLGSVDAFVVIRCHRQLTAVVSNKNRTVFLWIWGFYDWFMMLTNMYMYMYVYIYIYMLFFLIYDSLLGLVH